MDASLTSNDSMLEASLAEASFAQQRLWFIEKFEPGLPVYHIPIAVRLRGELNIGAVEKVLD